MKYWILSLTLFLFVPALEGQSDFRPGYLIDLSGDTLTGQIDYRGDILNCKKCVFRPSEEIDAMAFHPGEIQAYRFEGSKYYVSKELSINGTDELVFAEYLVNGIASLYYYRESTRDHYYIETRDGDLVELENPTVVVEGFDKRDYWTYSNKHVGILKAAFADSPEIQSELDKAQLSHQSLINFTARYHDYVCDDEVCIVYEKELSKAIVRFGPFFGSGLTSLNISVDPLYKHFDFVMTGFPFSGGLSMDLQLAGANEKVSILTSLVLTKNFYESKYVRETTYGTTEVFESQADLLSIAILPGAKYRMPGKRFRPMISAGLACRYQAKYEFSYSRTTISQWGEQTTNKKDTPFSGVQIGGFLGVGLEYALKEKKSLYLLIRYDYTWGFSQMIVEQSVADLCLGFYL